MEESGYPRPAWNRMGALRECASWVQIPLARPILQRVAKLDIAREWGSRDRRFKSSHADQFRDEGLTVSRSVRGRELCEFDPRHPDQV